MAEFSFREKIAVKAYLIQDFTVDADNIEEAKEKVRQIYRDGNYTIYDSDEAHTFPLENERWILDNNASMQNNYCKCLNDNTDIKY